MRSTLRRYVRRYVPPSVVRVVRRLSGRFHRGTAIQQASDLIEVRVEEPEPTATTASGEGHRAAALSALKHDLGCGANRLHIACQAALLLVEHPDSEAISALVDTMAMSGRPQCVKLVSAEVLRRMNTHDAKLALRRAASVTRRRWEWERSAEDALLLQILASGPAASATLPA